MALVETRVPSLGDRGEELYERAIRPLVEPKHNGKVLVIDVESGDYEFEGDDGWEGVAKMRARHPGHLFYFKRVGFPAVYHLRSPRLLKGSHD